MVEDKRRHALLAAVDSFRPIETALEIGSRGKNGNSDLMKERRKALTKARERRKIIQVTDGGVGVAENEDHSREVEMADESDIDVCSTILSCLHRPNYFYRLSLGQFHRSPRRGYTTTRSFTSHTVRLSQPQKKGTPTSDSLMFG